MDKAGSAALADWRHDLGLPGTDGAEPLSVVRQMAGARTFKVRSVHPLFSEVNDATPVAVAAGD